MRRTALAVAAHLLAASPVFAAGAFVTRTVQDGSGAHLQSYYDESGTGLGPFDPVFQIPNGAIGGGGAVYGPDATGQSPTKNPLLGGHLDANGKIAPNAPGTPDPVADINNASYTSAGAATASGTLPSPATMPTGGAPRGFAYSCGSTTPANSTTTLTLAGGGTIPLSVTANTAPFPFGYAVTAATAVTGCTFQALY